MFCSRLHDGPSQTRFMLACHPHWYLEYERTPVALAAPWLDYAAHCSDPLCGSELACQAPGQAGVLELAQRFAFGSMLIVPSPSVRMGTHIGVLVLGARDEGFFEAPTRRAVRVMARSLAMELHGWRLLQARRELIQRAQLSDTDIELLRRERKGLRTKDIARQLCMTAPAIDSRFQRLNARLGVPSRKAAASLAATFGIV
jgi:DNA-binding CsgD family transcriptional regulator